MKKSPQFTVHSPQRVTHSGPRPGSSSLPTREGRGARGGGLPRIIPVIILLITIAAFTSAFFPHTEPLASPSLLDLVQRHNIDDPVAELITTLRLPAPEDPSAFVLALAEGLGFRGPAISTLSGETRLNVSSSQDHTLSIRLHPVAKLWYQQVELQISLTAVHAGALVDTERQLRDLVHQLRPGDKTPVLVTISGTLPPERIARTQKDLIGKAFTSLKATITEGVSGENLESWSGFTTRLPDQIKVGHNKLNLQIATRYASEQNTVIIRIGTPLIVGTY